MGPGEIVLILIALLVLFGAKKLPEIGKSLGKGLREFKSATSEISNSISNEYQEPKPVNNAVTVEAKKETPSVENNVKPAENTVKKDQSTENKS